MKMKFADDKWGVYITPMIAVSWKEHKVIWIGWLWWLFSFDFKPQTNCPY